jgi:UDP-N-acetylglucosamine--N-acetylmuramyl-(pentapeptide) pyrophosphoryl-undecaprenol N-acetylglucosamine transferase
MRVLIAGGGTGGHLFPALAIAEELRRRIPECEILFVGSDRGMESRIVPQEGFSFAPVSIHGWNRRLGWKALTFVWFLVKGLWSSLMILRGFRPRVVVGTGGYVSGPALFWAAILGLPTLIQEQNSLPGATNRILSHLVDQVHISFAQSSKFFRKKDHLRLSGNPLRQRVGRVARERAAGVFSLDPSLKTVLVMGGSQGAHSINMSLAQDLQRTESAEMQVIWQTGPQDLEQIRQQFAARQPNTVVMDFIQDVGAAYGAADLIICRAGATTVAEVAACGLPAIFVPLPFATADHQRLNAQVLVEAGAAEMVLNGELQTGKLISTLIDLLGDENRLQSMARKSKALGRPEAARTVVRAIEELAGEA